jgi:predicted Zn-dependent protease
MDESDDALPITLKSDDDIGDWLYARLVGEYAEESEAWATERVARVMGKLNEVRAACSVPGAAPYRLTAHILWVGAMNAFAAPGRYIYLTRELLQRFGTDEPIALVLAHEAAHHDLGHARLLRPALSRLRSLPGNALLFILIRAAERLALGADQEEAADQYGLDLCLAAGYDAAKCLELFDILEAHLLDHGDVEGVFGPDLVSHANEGGWARWAAELHAEAWRRARGYPSLRARRTLLESQLRAA